jgi:Tfp pilus assembly protein PilN
MIKINLLSEKKPSRTRAAGPIRIEGAGSGGNLLLGGIFLLGLVVAGGWWWMLAHETAVWERKLAEADAELKRLEPAIKKSDELEKQKALLARKIDLIMDLKVKQDVPVHIMDQISRNLPDFLWLESMSATNNKISLGGKATTYNAVSNFYSNLTGSGYFNQVVLGRTFEVPAGVSFSLTCEFTGVPKPDQGTQG